MIWPWQRREKPLGQRGEDLAARYLRRNGYTILDRNVKLGRYELDIIARDGDTIAFVEVKTRLPSDIATPEDSITTKKRKHLTGAARIYMQRNPAPDTYYRFDVVAITIPPTGKPEIKLYKNAFVP
ncbi:MAG: YraN family protein [Bdellovibrionota bacterium]